MRVSRLRKREAMSTEHVLALQLSVNVELVKQ